MPPFDPRKAALDDLANWTGGAQPGSINHTAGMAELTRRQIVGQIEATEAQRRAAAAEERAADAAIEGAAATNLNAKYMLWSVIAAATSTFIALVSTIYTLSHGVGR